MGMGAVISREMSILLFDGMILVGIMISHVDDLLYGGKPGNQRFNKSMEGIFATISMNVNNRCVHLLCEVCQTARGLQHHSHAGRELPKLGIGYGRP